MGGAAVQPTAIAPCEDAKPSSFVWSLDRTSDVGRALLAATRRLRESGADTPQLDSAVLMAHVLGVSKAWAYAHPTRQLTELEISRFESLVRRRMCYEPVAYLVGHKSFYGLDITVDDRVLIPRPETEVPVEYVLAYARHLVRDEQHPLIADVGTGSGAIAIALAVNLPQASIYAVDLSDDALAVAAQNVWRYGLGDQVQLLPGNLFDPLPEPVHIIVANLPYVASAELADLPRQVRDYEPMSALDGGCDGLTVFETFFAAMTAADHRKWLLPGGRVFLEIGAEQGDALTALVERALPGTEVDLILDYAGRDRLVVVST